MGIRAKCLRDGHKFRPVVVPLPFVFCARWFCNASTVSATYPMTGRMRAMLAETAEEKNRELLRGIGEDGGEE